MGTSNVMVIDARKAGGDVKAPSDSSKAPPGVDLYVLKPGMKFDLDQGLVSR